MNSSNIMTGLTVAGMLPLDTLTYANSEYELFNLGLNNANAFLRYDGFKVFNRQLKEDYIWLDVATTDNNVFKYKGGDFRYPASTIVDNINYSNKLYAFFTRIEKEGEITPPSQRIDNKNTPGVKILDTSDNKLKTITGNQNIVVTEVNGVIQVDLFKKAVIKPPVDFIKYDTSMKLGDKLVVKDLSELRALKEGSEYEFAERIRLLVNDNVNATFNEPLPDFISKVELGKSSKIKFQGPISGGVTITGGTLDLSNAELPAGELTMANIKLDSTGTFRTAPNTKLILKDSLIMSKGSKIGIIGGDSLIQNATISKQTRARSADTEVSEPLFSIVGIGTATLESSTLNTNNIFEVTGADAKVEFKGNSVGDNITGPMTSGDGINITSFGNNLNEAKISDLEVVKSYNDVTKNGVEIGDLRRFPNRREADANIGKNKLFINTKNGADIELHFLDITI